MKATRLTLTLAAILSTSAVHADIYRWDTGEVIPGTEGIEPGPGSQLDRWNTESHNLRFAGFSGGINLQNSYFEQSWLDNADFSRANLTNADLYGATLLNTDFTDSTVAFANLSVVTHYGFTKEQLYSTASYKSHDLRGIRLAINDLTEWDLRDQDLTDASFMTLIFGDAVGATLTEANLSRAKLHNANFASTRLTNANFTGADLRGAANWGGHNAGATVNNTILPDGRLESLTLIARERLLIRDDDGVSDPAATPWLAPREPILVTLQQQVTIADGATLNLIFESDPWDSLISFEPGIPVQLGGALELSFADDVDVFTQVGRTFHVFDWTGVSPSGAFAITSPHGWDVSQLYTTGEVRVVAVPEPPGGLVATIGAVLAACGALLGRSSPPVDTASRTRRMEPVT